MRSCSILMMRYLAHKLAISSLSKDRSFNSPASCQFVLALEDLWAFGVFISFLHENRNGENKKSPHALPCGQNRLCLFQLQWHVRPAAGSSKRTANGLFNVAALGVITLFQARGSLSTLDDFRVKVVFLRGEESRRVGRKTLGVRLRSTNLSCTSYYSR